MYVYTRLARTVTVCLPVCYGLYYKLCVWTRELDSTPCIAIKTLSRPRQLYFIQLFINVNTDRLSCNKSHYRSTNRKAFKTVQSCPVKPCGARFVIYLTGLEVQTVTPSTHPQQLDDRIGIR